MLSYSLKTTKINRGTQNFSKRKVKVRKTSIVEVGASLELYSCSRKLCESWLQKLFIKNNYPLVQFHCILKIMCQGFPLGFLQCLLVCAVQERNFGCSAWFYIFLLERQTVLKLFALSFYTNCLFFLILEEFWGYQKYGECSYYYKLPCLRQILFLMHSLLVLMKLSISISGLSHGKVILQ